MDVSLVIHELTTLQGALGAFITPEVLQGSNQWMYAL